MQTGGTFDWDWILGMSNRIAMKTADVIISLMFAITTIFTDALQRQSGVWLLCFPFFWLYTNDLCTFHYLRLSGWVTIKRGGKRTCSDIVGYLREKFSLRVV